MPRSYRHIEIYKNEILQMKNSGKTNREVEEKLNFTVKQIKNFLYRHSVLRKKLNSEIILHKKGRPTKNCIVTEKDKINDLKYIIAHKNAKINNWKWKISLCGIFSHKQKGNKNIS